jgi:hypothetical protein
MAAILKGHKQYWGKIAIYGDYNPWTGHKEDDREITCIQRTRWLKAKSK